MNFLDRIDGMNNEQLIRSNLTNNVDFDATDEESWYFDEISREESISALQNQADGTFLVRPSSTIQGDLVLSVKENPKVSHYIINVSQEQSRIIYRIGDKTFTNMKDLLTFYKSRPLDTSSLTRICPKPRVRAKYNFDGKDDEDLPFRKGDIMMIIKKVEPLWWLARKTNGDQGVIPANYVDVLSF